MYGLAKVHKIVTYGLPLFRLILSATSISAYKLEKFLVPMLEPLTADEYTIKDSSTFVEELQSFNSKLAMASFDIESRFTNILLQETIDLVLIFFLKMELMLIICRKTHSVSCLLEPYLNH